ncbi:hypothetical protein MHYP_G00003960 [Metynnis hypsauchen]
MAHQSIKLHMERFITLYLITASGVFADTIDPKEEDANMIVLPILCSYKAASVPVCQVQLCATMWQHFCTRLHIIVT